MRGHVFARTSLVCVGVSNMILYFRWIPVPVSSDAHDLTAVWFGWLWQVLYIVYLIPSAMKTIMKPFPNLLFVTQL